MASLSSEERKLLTIQGFMFLSYALASVFVTVFFFSHSDIKTTMLYRAAAFASMTFFYGLSGWTLRKVSSGFLMKMSMAAGALSYLLLFLLKEQSVAYAIPLGLLDGFTGGNFWAGFNLNQYILTRRGRRLHYFGWTSAIINTASAVGPIVGGAIITLVGKSSLSLSTGYAALFFLVFAILSAALIVTGKLPSHQAPQFRYLHIWEHKRSLRWKLVLGQQALMGCYDVLLGTLAGILLFLIVKGEFSLGLVTTATATFAAFGSLISIRVLGKHKAMFWVGSVGAAFALFFFALNQNYAGVIVYALSGLTAPFLMNSLSMEFLDTVDHMRGEWQHKYHALLERDILLGTLRTASYVAFFIFLGFGDQATLAKKWLLFLPVLPLSIGMLLQLSHRRERQMPESVPVESTVMQESV